MFTNSKIIIFKRFLNDVLYHTFYTSWLYLITIDELHLMSKWKNFRSKYARLKILRTRLSNELLVLKISTTFDVKTLNFVKKQCEFFETTKIIKTFLNKFEIYMQYNVLKFFMKKWKNLQFLLSKKTQNYLNVSKIVVYIDEINKINEICELMKQWISKLKYSTNARNWICSFSTFITTNDKNRIQKKFKKSFVNCLNSRIFVCTKIYELRMNNKNIKKIVQLLISFSITKIYQRLRKINRKNVNQINFIFFYSK